VIRWEKQNLGGKIILVKLIIGAVRIA